MYLDLDMHSFEKIRSRILQLLTIIFFVSISTLEIIEMQTAWRSNKMNQVNCTYMYVLYSVFHNSPQCLTPDHFQCHGGMDTCH